MSYKILGQSAPALATVTTLYTCPSAKETVVSTLVIANRNPAASDIRIAVRPTADALSNKHYLYYDLTIPANETFAATIGITLAVDDLVVVYDELGYCSFSLFGNENDL